MKSRKDYPRITSKKGETVKLGKFGWPHTLLLEKVSDKMIGLTLSVQIKGKKGLRGLS